MQQRTAKLLFFLFIITKTLCAQDTEIDGLIKGELKMTFPRVYFKNRSTDYAPMPYSPDSCFKYIANNIQDVRSLVIWRDSSETEQLTTQRIKKLKADLNKYTPATKLYIESMKAKQRVLQSTISKANSVDQRQYLLSLNSVFDVYTTIIVKKKWHRRTHLEGRYLCFGCWRRGAFSKDYQRLHGRKAQKQNATR